MEDASKIGEGTSNGYEGESSSCSLLVSCTAVLVTVSLLVELVASSISLVSSSGDDDRNAGVVDMVVYEKETCCRITYGI